MSFRLFIYYCALCGGGAAFVGWAVGRMPDLEHNRVLQMGVKGLFLGLTTLGLALIIDRFVFNAALFQGGLVDEDTGRLRGLGRGRPVDPGRRGGVRLLGHGGTPGRLRVQPRDPRDRADRRCVLAARFLRGR